MLQAIRGLLLCVTVFFFRAEAPSLAEAIAIFFAQPMILTVLSALMRRTPSRGESAQFAGWSGRSS